MKQLGLFTGQVSERSTRFDPSALYFETPEDLELVLERLSIVDVGLFYWVCD